MLELRPNCELCDCDLSPDSVEARICTYECTFCATCVESVLENVCPNCGGGFEKRPIRPVVARRESVSLEHHPASKIRVRSEYTQQQLTEFSNQHKHINPRNR